MKRIISLLVVISFCGCATLPSYRESSKAQLMLKTFFTNLQNQDYEDSYKYFSEDLRRTISLSQHSELMKLFHDKLGIIESYKTLPNTYPFPVLIDESLFQDPFRNNGGIIWLYELQYAKEPVTARVEVGRKNGQYLIESFACFSDKIYDDENVRNKVKALGIPVSEDSEGQTE